MGWTKPTNIQQLAIPAILHMSSSSSIINNKKEAQSDDDDDDDNGKDENNYYDSVWCTSPTGSGKTASFALPILQLIIQQKQQQRQEEEDTTGQRRRIKHHHRSQGDGSSKPTALILCPTRELAIQTYSVFMELLSHIHQHQSTTATPVTVRAIYGGTSSSSSSSSSSFDNDNDDNDDNVDIVVATPGRLLDILHLGPTKSSRVAASDATLNEKEDDDDDDEDPRRMAALERRILMALDAKSSSSSSTSSYNERRNDGGLRKRKMKRGGSSSRGSSRSNSASSSSYYEESTASLDIDEIQRLLEGIDDDDDVNDTATASSDMLNGLQYLIIDEADRLLGKAFENEIDLLLSLIATTTTTKAAATPTISSSRSSRRRDKLQTMLFSATFPKQIENRVERVLSQLGCDSALRLSTVTATASIPPPTTTTMLEVNNTNNAGNSILLSSFDVDNYGKESSNNNNADVVADMDDMHTSDHKQFVNDNNINDVPRIRHRVIRLNETDRTRALRFLITNKEKEKQQQQYNTNKGGSEGNDNDEMMMEERILVFVATRHSAEHVTKKLNRYNIRASELHGKLNQADRDRTLNGFRCGKVHVLVATDLAARGLDVHGLSTVINYDLPRSPDDFIHRVGRTGRAGYGGTSITFITAQTESHFNYLEKKVLLLPPTAMSLASSTGKIEREVLDGFVINEMTWTMQVATSTASVPGATHSELGLGHDRTFGGIKGRRKSKKDKLREAAGSAAAAASSASTI
jgi:superfamily II DNA/RNA helicase